MSSNKALNRLVTELRGTIQAPEPIVEAKHDPHAWIDALALPEDRRPDPSASTWTLFRYLAKRWWARVKPWGRWTVVRDTGITVYEQHRNGNRRASQRGGGYQPLDHGWVAGGDWSPKPAPGAISGVPERRSPSSQNVSEGRAIASRLISGGVNAESAAHRVQWAFTQEPPPVAKPISGRRQD